MRSLRILALVTAAFAYALIVLGAVVRITGSGMGCGDDWPLCQGRLIPPLDDIPTVIEWSHRLAAAGVSALVVTLAAVALAKRREPEMSGAGGPMRPALIAAALLVTQVLLGGVTVWLVLPPPVVTLHLATAFALLAALVIVVLRAGRTARAARPAPSRAARRGVGVAVALGALALLLGGLTASTGAGFACQGFPLCGGQLWPATQSRLAEIQWVHRLMAYALLLHLAGLGVRFTTRREPARRLAWAAAGLAVLQVAVAAVMVTRSLPAQWRAGHAAVGAALWIVLVCLAARVYPWVAGRAWPRETR